MSKYRLSVFYSISKPNDIDIVQEGEYDGRTFETRREALGELCSVINYAGGFEMWDDIDGRVGSCWLNATKYVDNSWRTPDETDDDGNVTKAGEPYEVEFQAHITRIDDEETWRDMPGNPPYKKIVGTTRRERELNLTLKRLEVFK